MGGKAVYSDQEFIELWNTHQSGTAMAKAVGMDLRNILRRKSNLEARYGQQLKSKNNKAQTVNLVFHRRDADKSRAIKILGTGQQYLTAIILDANGLYWLYTAL